MRGKLLSVRLDERAADALRLLSDAGMSQSEAVRFALTQAADERTRRAAIGAEASALAADEADRAEKSAIAAELDEISDPW